MKKKFRVTFNNEPTGSEHKVIDISAENIDEAFHLAYQNLTATERRFYTNAMTEEIPEGPTTIGVKFEYYDTAIKRSFTGYIMIRANSEQEAVKYYNENFLGGRFWFKAAKTEPDGKCIRGKVLETYFAGTPGYDADATAERYFR